LEHHKVTTEPNIAASNAETGDQRKAKPVYIKLNAKNIAKLKPPQTGRAFYCDTLLTSFALCLHASGTGTYTVNLSVRGGKARPQKKIGRMDRWTPEEARAKAQQWLADADRGIDPIAKIEADAAAAVVKQAVSDVTLAKLTALYLADVKPGLRPATFAEYSRLLKHPGAVLGERIARDISESDIEDYLAERRISGHGPVETAKQLLALRQLFRWGCKTYNRTAKAKYLAADPCLHITKPKPPKPRERWLDDDEMASFWHACGTIGWPWEHLFKLLLLLGQRRNETTNMRWSQIKDGVWHIPASLAKNGKAHDVFLPPLARDILAAIPRFAGEGCDLAFSLDGRGVVNGFSYAKARVAKAMTASLGSTAPWSLHDLRRSMASGMAGLGIAPHVLDKCLNHQTGTLSAIALVYNRHQYRAEREAAHRQWAEHIAQITGENVVRLTA
jgi:integrase